MVDSTLTDNPSVDSTFKDKTSTDNTRSADAPGNDLHILPIRYWLISVAMAALFVGGISAWHSIFQGHVDIPPAEEYNIDRLTTPSEGLRIVAMGDSFVRYSFPLDERLDKIALEQGLSIKSTRFTKNRGNPQHFEVLLPHILAAKPDFVFIEAGPFIIKSERESLSFLAAFRNGIRNIRKKSRGLKSGRLFLENSQRETDKTEDWTTKPEMVANRLKELLATLKFSEAQLPKPFEEFIQAAHAQGTRVILLDLGHAKVVNEAFPPEFHAQISNVLSKLEARYPMEVWQFPANLPLTHYKDIAHLNATGQQVFINWLLARIRDEVKKND